MNQEFAHDLMEGLSQSPKRMYSKYMYDDKGDKLFQQIMHMEEYYPTNCEYDIFKNQTKQLTAAIAQKQPFQLIELGAGDGYKTKVLLDYLVNEGVDFTYYPIDISGAVLKELSADLKTKWPELQFEAVEDTYFKAIDRLASEKPKVILFLGGNIGNFIHSKAVQFLKEAAAELKTGDLFLIGMDLKKHPQTILSAYNDKQGITRDFNLNLLDRINKEFDADFDLSEFDHYPTYNPVNGETKSYLISLKNQIVHFEKLNEKVEFAAAEPIFMELSKKFSKQEIKELAESADFEVIENFTDSKKYFVDSLWRKK
jgi:dimethylhistidine N-methyltransferase